MYPLNRRQFLFVGAGTAGAILLNQCSRNISSLPLARPASATVLKTANNGLLEVSLSARSSLIELGGQRGKLMTYNGQIPAPRLEAKPGDTIRIHFTNELAQATNLHYHGLHVPPTGKADNIFINVSPGESQTYEFTLPKDHPAGTFYYHPHMHEMVAEQVFGGLGGIFVVRGDLDEIPEIRAAKEEFLFLKDFALDESGEIPPIGHMDSMRGREGAILTVNGRVNPTFTLASDGLLRLRIVNASTSRFYRLSLAEHPLYLIATDGGAIAKPIELQELLLSPGERAEVLVRGNRTSGKYRLLNLPYDRGGTMGMMGGMMGDSTPTTDEAQAIATIAYRGSVAQPLPLPQKLIAVDALPAPTQTRRIELSMSMGMGMGMGRGMQMAFLFNGKTFDLDQVDELVKVGTVEDWELVNVDPDAMEHSFHLHTNRFQVMARNGKPDPYPAWKDTIRVRADETVLIRIPFKDFAGKTVYHCHVLDHEDLGMMGIVEMKT